MGQISEITLFIPIFGILGPVTDVTSYRVTVMTSWWNISGMFRMSKIFRMLRHTQRHRSMTMGLILKIILFIPQFGTFNTFTEMTSEYTSVKVCYMAFFNLNIPC